jgi:hypothetical protein
MFFVSAIGFLDQQTRVDVRKFPLTPRGLRDVILFHREAIEWGAERTWIVLGEATIEIETTPDWTRLSELDMAEEITRRLLTALPGEVVAAH